VRAFNTFDGPVLARSNGMEFSALLQRVRAEFNEMPGLRLTPAQAARLLGLDASSCQRVLNALVGADFLRRTPDGSVVRSES
jgi:DNA-binding IclR family transcriptional regulator